MKSIISSFLLITFIFLYACTKDENVELNTLNDTGTLFVSGGLYDCPYQIVLDDNTILHPSNHELLIPFKSEQRLNISYKLANDFKACEEATGINLLEVEAVDCLPYVDLYFYNYDSLKNDPLNVEDAFIENDCLILEISYSGCTKDHPVDLSLAHPSCATPPIPPPSFFINHDSRKEDCEMLVRKTLSYDLTPLKDYGNKIEFIVYYSISETEVESLNFTYFY